MTTISLVGLIDKSIKIDHKIETLLQLSYLRRNLVSKSRQSSFLSIKSRIDNFKYQKQIIMLYNKK